MIAFIIGLFIGAWLGVLLCGLCVAGRGEEETYEEMKRRNKDK